MSATHRFLVIGFGLVGCAPPSPPAPTVAYYRAHEAERRLLVSACANDPAQARGRADCINAYEAESLEGIGSWPELPPLALPNPRADRSSPQPE